MANITHEQLIEYDANIKKYINDLINNNNTQYDQQIDTINNEITNLQDNINTTNTAAETNSPQLMRSAGPMLMSTSPLRSISPASIVVQEDIQEDYIIYDRVITPNEDAEYKNIVVTTDDSSNRVFFSMYKTFDDRTLIDKHFSVIWINAAGYKGETDCVDIQTIANRLYFAWNIPYAATRTAGTIKYAIRITTKDYVWNTLPADIECVQGLMDDAWEDLPDAEGKMEPKLDLSFCQITYDDNGHITSSVNITPTQLDALNSGVSYNTLTIISDIQTTCQNLQNQINEIVRAPESGGDVGAEVYQARVGASGTDYSTLKDRLDSEINQANQSIIYVDKALSTTVKLGEERITDNLFEIHGYIQYTEGRVITGESDNYRYTTFMRVYKGQKIEWSLATNLHVAYMLLLKEPDFTSEVLDYGKELISENVVKHSVYTVVEDGYIVLSSVVNSSSWYCFKTALNEVNDRITYVDDEIRSFEIDNGVLINEDDFGINGYIQYAEGKVTTGESNNYYRTNFMRVRKGQKITWRLTTNKHVAYMLLLREADFTSDVLDYGKETDSENIMKSSMYTVVEDGYIVISCMANSSSWYIINPIIDYHKIQLEGGCFSSETYYSFASRDYINWRRTAYRIFVTGVKSIRFRQPDYVNAVTYRFFDANGDKIEARLSEWKYQFIPNNTAWIEFELSGKADTATVEFVGEKSMSVSEKKRIQRHTPSEKLTYKVSDKLFDTSRLMLPPNYSVEGDAVPLILWLDGSGNFTTWDDEISQVKVPYLQYLNNEGFAVLSVFSWGYNLWYDIVGLGNSHPYVLPTNLECIKKCIEYMIDRYNIDPNQIHVMSKSQGGQVALYYASNNEINAKTIGMFAPVLDYFSMPGEAMYKGTREGIAKCLGLEGDVNYYTSDEYYTFSDQAKSFLTQNLAKMCRLNSSWANLNGGTLAERFEDSWQDGKKYWEQRYWEHTDRTDIYTHSDYSKFATVPVMIWGAADDDNTPYLKMAEVVEQLKNGGSEAYLRTLPNNTGRHSAADVSTINVVSGTTALGIPYVDIPVGWVENVAFIRQHSPEIEYDESKW